LSGITFENTASFMTDYRAPVDSFGFRLGVTGSSSSARLFSMAFGNAVGSFTSPQSTAVSAVEATGTATIFDDGTGTGGTNDDRAMSVNNITVNEASPYAVFTVTATLNQNLSLLNQAYLQQFQ
jgi:hypothetical protein